VAKALIGGDRPQAASAMDRSRALVGRVISDRYRIVELVAMGAMGSVYRGEHLLMHKEMAIKVLHPETEGFPELVTRFEREAVAGAHIKHPNVAAASDFGKFDGESRFLVLEFIRGETLNDRIARGPVPAVQAAKIARQLAAALGATHQKGIVHRDVKPRNVMILDGKEDSSEWVKLIDFGLAKVPVAELSTLARDPDAAHSSLTNAGVVMGTVAYMAPETAMGMRAVQARADLYSLGVVFYEMLAGKHPFDAQDPTILFALHRSQKPPPLIVRNPEVRVYPAIERVVMKLLEKDPDARYPDADAVIEAIDAAMADAGTKRSAPRVTAARLAEEVAAYKPSVRSVSWLGWALACVGAAAAVAVAIIAFKSPGTSTNGAASAAETATAEPTATAPVASATPRLRELLKTAAEGDGSQAATAVLEIAKNEPSAFDDRAVQATVAAAAQKAALGPSPEADELFTQLATKLGPAGLDVLYDVSTNEGSKGSERAKTWLGKPEVIANGTPAMKVAWELRRTVCAQRPYLFGRAAQEGDDRALAVLTAMQPPACDPLRGQCCFRRHGELERAVTTIQARIRR
jgi:eukaryotic-like serine/threonine-protein kinase